MVAALALWLAGEAVAQSVKDLPGPTAIGARAFDRAAAIVDAGAISVSLRDVIALFAVGPKGEFETTRQYEERSRVALPDRYFAVSVAGSRLCTPAWSYDADKETMRGFVLLNRARADGHSLIAVNCASHDVGTYEASNAFGAKVTVTEKRDTVYSIRPTPSLDIGVMLDLSVSMSVDTARIAKPNLGAIVVFRPAVDAVGRAVFSETEFSGATRDYPTKRTVEHFIINVDRDAELWVYNQRTGTIYRKVKIAAAKG